MTLPHDQLCAVCRQRPRWAARWLCKPCYLELRLDLRELVDAHRRLGDVMVLLPPSWRTSAIRTVRSIGSPIPFDPELSLQRDRITNTLAYWARMVLDAALPRRWPPDDVTVDALSSWLIQQLGWIVRNPAVGQFANDISGLRMRGEQLAPREYERRRLPLPCPQCGELSLTERAGLVECARGVCRHVMTLAAYHALENEIEATLGQDEPAAA